MAAFKNITPWYTLTDNTNIKKKKILIPMFYACQSLLLLLLFSHLPGFSPIPWYQSDR